MNGLLGASRILSAQIHDHLTWNAKSGWKSPPNLCWFVVHHSSSHGWKTRELFPWPEEMITWEEDLIQILSGALALPASATNRAKWCRARIPTTTNSRLETGHLLTCILNPEHVLYHHRATAWGTLTDLQWFTDSHESCRVISWNFKAAPFCISWFQHWCVPRGRMGSKRTHVSHGWKGGANDVSYQAGQTLHQCLAFHWTKWTKHFLFGVYIICIGVVALLIVFSPSGVRHCRTLAPSQKPVRRQNEQYLHERKTRTYLQTIWLHDTFSENYWNAAIILGQPITIPLDELDISIFQKKAPLPTKLSIWSMENANKQHDARMYAHQPAAGVCMANMQNCCRPR